MEPLGEESKGIVVPPAGAVVPARRARPEAVEAALIESNGYGDAYYGLDASAAAASPFGRLPSFAALWRWKWVMLTIFLIVAAPATFCIWKFVKPLYKSTALIQIDPIMPIVLERTPESGAIPFFRNYLNSQVAQIKGSDVLSRVLDAVKNTRWFQNRPRPLFGNPPNDYDRLRQELSVGILGDSNIIVVSIRTEVAGDGSTIVNALNEKYVEWFRDRRTKELEPKQVALGEERTKRQGALTGLEAVRDQRITELRTVDSTSLLAQLATHVSGLESEIATLDRQAKLTKWRIEKLTDAQELAKAQTRPVEGAAAAGVDERYYAQDQEWRELKLGLENSIYARDVAAQRFGASHPRMLEATSEVEHREKLLRGREAQLRYERDSVVASIAKTPIGDSMTLDLPTLTAIQEAQRKELELRGDELTLVRKDLETKIATAGELGKLNDQIREAQAALVAVDARLAEMELQNRVLATVRTTNAVTPSLPDGDRRIVFTAMAMIVALALGLGVAYLGTVLDPTIREVGDVRGTVHAPFLGQLPEFPNKTHLINDSSPPLIEGMRMVRTALLERLRGGSERVVLVTSSSPRTGKSTVAMLLARSLALVHKRVLLVEADLHRPSLGGYLQIESTRGLIALLAGDASDRDVICRTSVPRLDVVLAGDRTAGFDPELLANGVFSACLRRWKSAYDYVVIDSPPVLPVADARILARQVDGTVMVLRSSRCKRPDVVQAYADLSAAGGTLLGTVLVGSKQREKYGYGEGYSYSHYLTTGATSGAES